MIVATSRSSLILHCVFIVLLLANFVFWAHARKILPKWNNVPPAPTNETAGFSGLGDKEIAYRLTGYMLQNLGNIGGRFEALKNYDYDALGEWFFVAQSLDGRANYIPYLASFYYGAIQDEAVAKLDPVIDYLVAEGQQPYPQKWRWLAQAVYLARFRQHDLDKALKLANILANLKTDTAPWARQMPAFVHMQMGDKQASYEIMIRMLATEQDKLDPNEVNAIKAYICEQTLTPEEAAKNPLCATEK